MSTAAPLPQDDSSLVIAAETRADAQAIEALVLRAFGPGRFAKTAERLRERAAQGESFVARSDGAIIGSVRLWDVSIGDAPALFLGPIAVERAARDSGVGARLVQACVDHARAERSTGILLIGDPPYFSRFGFVQAEDVRLSGPVDPRRLLWLPVTQNTPEGLVAPLI